MRNNLVSRRPSRNLRICNYDMRTVVDYGRQLRLTILIFLRGCLSESYLGPRGDLHSRFTQFYPVIMHGGQEEVA